MAGLSRSGSSIMSDSSTRTPAGGLAGQIELVDQMSYPVPVLVAAMEQDHGPNDGRVVAVEELELVVGAELALRP